MSWDRAEDTVQNVHILREAGGSQLQPDPGQEPGTVTKAGGLGAVRAQAWAGVFQVTDSPDGVTPDSNSS